MTKNQNSLEYTNTYTRSDCLNMSESFDKEFKKPHKYTINKKHTKKDISDDQKFANKAKKAFKNRVKELQEDEILDDIEHYDKFR